MKTWLKIQGVALSFMLGIAALSADAQEQACTARPRAGGAYDVQISGAPFVAVPREKFKEYIAMDGDLKEAREKIKKLEEMIASTDVIKGEHEKQIKDLEQLLAKQKEYASGLEIANKKCEKAMKACAGSYRLTLEGGVGLTGDADPALMLGVGYGKLRAWGFLQSGNSGALVGVSLPIF